MKNSILFRSLLACAVVTMFALALSCQTARAENWNNIEPLKSRRADVERVLGQPLKSQPGETGTLHFKVAGGKVTVLFVSAKFVQTKKLDPALEGTVLQIVLQHENSSNTPESMGLKDKSGFEREEIQGSILYRNVRDGIHYTFINGKLRTTRYSPTADQLVNARVR